MNSDLLDVANAKLCEYLTKCQLDRIIAYSVELRMCFVTEALPKREIWLTLSGIASIDEDMEIRSDFFDQRSRFLSQIYLLIGGTISNVEITQNGQLKISIDGKWLVIESDGESYEEVWSVTPDSSSQFDEFDWFVTYTDEGELLVK